VKTEGRVVVSGTEKLVLPAREHPVKAMPVEQRPRTILVVVVVVRVVQVVMLLGVTPVQVLQTGVNLDMGVLG
jgi:hypothetical protein